MEESVPTSIKVVEGVAAHEGVDPMNLEPPLHEVIDTDALDALFRPTDDSSDPAVAVEFTYCGTQVRVDGSGQVDVTAAAAEQEPSAEAD